MTRIYNALQRYQQDMDGVSRIGVVHRLITTTLPRDKLVALYGSIEQMLPVDAPRIVQFASSTSGEGVTTVARDLAVTVASVTGKRVLLITVVRPRALQIAPEAPEGLEATIAGTAAAGDVIDAVPGLPLFETTLSSIGGAGKHFFDAPALAKALRSALALVDLVIIDTPPLLTDFAGAALARYCGGTLLVIEAERTRGPKAEEARRIVEAHGGRVIGVVLNKRRWHIPQFIYRRLQ